MIIGRLLNIITQGLGLGEEDVLVSSPITTTIIPLQQLGGQKIQHSTIQQIRRMFGLSGNITIERKIKRDVVGEVLYQILHDKKFFGTVYNKLNKSNDVYGDIHNSITTYKGVYGNASIPYEQRLDFGGIIYKSVKNDIVLSGTVCDNVLIHKNINGLVLKKQTINQFLDGKILNKIYKQNNINGGILIKGSDDKNIIKKAISFIDDDEMFLSTLMKKYKI